MLNCAPLSGVKESEFSSPKMLLWLIYLVNNSKTYLGVNLKCPSLIRFEFSRHFCIQFSSLEFHTNPSSGNRADTWGQTDGYNETNRFCVCVCVWVKRKRITPNYRLNGLMWAETCSRYQVCYRYTFCSTAVTGVLPTQCLHQNQNFPFVCIWYSVDL